VRRTSALKSLSARTHPFPTARCAVCLEQHPPSSKSEAFHHLRANFVHHKDPAKPDEDRENNKVDEQQHRCPDTAVNETPVHIEWQLQNENSDRDVVAPGSPSDQAHCTCNLHDPKTDQDERERPVVMLY
jgi:hypothetical protein